MLSFLYLVSMLFADLLSLHLVTFLMFFFILVIISSFTFSKYCFLVVSTLVQCWAVFCIELWRALIFLVVFTSVQHTTVLLQMSGEGSPPPQCLHESAIAHYSHESTCGADASVLRGLMCACTCMCIHIIWAW